MRNRTYLFILLFLTIPLQGQSQRVTRPGFSLPANTKSIRIPVEVQHNVIIIPIRINGSFEMDFILDTGVRSTILTEPFLTQFLRLDSVSKVRVRGLGEGEDIYALLAKDLNIDLPGVRGKHMNLLVLPEDVISYSGMFGRPVYGIIGNDVFSQFVVEINYSRKYIQLHDPTKYKPRKKAEAVPIKIRNGKPYVKASITDFRGETIDGQWLLDTGSSNALSLYDSSLPIPDPSIPAFLGKGLSGNVYGRLARAPEFKMGSFDFTDVITGYPDSNSLNIQITDSLWYGNIGSEVLSRFQVTFDYFRGIVYLKKTAGFQHDFEYNVSGIEIVSEGDFFNIFKIAYVRPGSPADEADVRPGDEIVMLNGLDVSNMNISAVYATILKKNGRQMVMKIRRDEEIIKKKFALIPEI